MGFTRKIYFIQEHRHEEFFHGGIGPADIERILVKEGAIPLFFPSYNDFSLKAKWQRFNYLLRQLRTIEDDAIVFFQYPLYARMHYWLLRLLQRFRKKVQLICLIDEINGLKYGKPALLAWEQRYFQRFDYFIVHNAHMKAWFDEQVPGRQISILELFDFLASPVTAVRAPAPTVAYAGNLSESGFQYQLHQLTGAEGQPVFHLYGLPAMDNAQLPSQVIYKGAFAPYDLPAQIEAAYGLVWDGESTDAVTGSFGQYMQYISHHKVSLHIISNLPSLVYEQAGTADFITANGIGLTIRNLHDIEETLKQVTPEQYQQMCVNMQPIAARLASGGHLIGALTELLEKMNAVKPDQG